MWKKIHIFDMIMVLNIGRYVRYRHICNGSTAAYPITTNILIAPETAVTAIFEPNQIETLWIDPIRMGFSEKNLYVIYSISCHVKCSSKPFPAIWAPNSEIFVWLLRMEALIADLPLPQCSKLDLPLQHSCKPDLSLLHSSKPNLALLHSSKLDQEGEM